MYINYYVYKTLKIRVFFKYIPLTCENNYLTNM